MRQTYGKLLPGMKLSDLAGKLIVIEGRRMGRANHADQPARTRQRLEENGHAVLDTGMRPALARRQRRHPSSQGRQQSGARHPRSLLYATGFINQLLENEIVPALRAGFVVLTDRYIYSLMARPRVGGWIRSGFKTSTASP